MIVQSLWANIRKGTIVSCPYGNLDLRTVLYLDESAVYLRSYLELEILANQRIIVCVVLKL